MAEIITVKCPKCGWEQKVVKGKLIAVYCPHDRTRIPIKKVKKPKVDTEKVVKEAEEEVKKNR